MTEADVIEMIRRRADELGTISALAAEMGLSIAYVSQVLRGKRKIGRDFLSHFGIEKVVTYRRAQATSDGDTLADEAFHCLADTCMELAAEVDHLRDLNDRALAIIAEAIMHGMPITEEVAAVRNGIATAVAIGGTT